MRIIQIIGKSGFGGGFYYIHTLSLRLRELGHDVFILTENPEVAEGFKRAGFEILSTNNFKREISPYHDLKTLLRLKSILRKISPDLVHTHTSKGGFIGRIAARIAKRERVVHTVHGFAFHEFSSPFGKFFYSSLERLASLFCDRLIFVNKKDATFAERLGIGNKRIRRIIYNGVDWEAIEKVKPHYEIKEELGIPKDSFLISFVGRLSPQKNPGLLISAMPDLLQEYPLTYLLLIGDGELKGKCLEMVKKRGIEGNVKFLGFRRDCVSLIKATDCFVLPSLWEGLSISLLEAMASGLPCVVSDIKGNNEVIVNGENGLIFPPLVKEALVARIGSLIKDRDLRAKLSLAAKRTIRERFSSERFLKETLEIYQELGVR